MLYTLIKSGFARKSSGYHYRGAFVYHEKITKHVGGLAPVVQRADNSIQRITRYPVDKMYQKKNV